MKKFSFVFAVLLAITFTANAQDKKERKGEPKDPTEHIVKALELDDAAAAKFTETYKAYREDAKALRPTPAGEGKKFEDKTEAEAEIEIQQQFEYNQKLLDLRKSYFSKYREFMTPKQIQKFYRMERRMNDHARDRRGPGGNRGPKGPRPEQANND